jgi:addiction module RelB/DinJ family antitoxin
MERTSTLSIRIDPEIEATVDGIYSRFGITIADAVNIFLHKSIMAGGLPFDMTVPQYNAETQAYYPGNKKLGGMEGKICTADDFNAPLDCFEEYTP